MTVLSVHPSLLLNQYDWSIDKYHRLIDHGILTENDRVELLLGKIVKMSPIGKMHAACITKLNKLLYPQFVSKYELRSENPIALPNNSEPEPDYVIANISADNYLSGHPGPEDILLVIEVADRTLTTDRELKLQIYANAGISDYWIINLIDLQVECFSEPQEDGSYVNQKIYSLEDRINSPMIGQLEVKDLLP